MFVNEPLPIERAESQRRTDRMIEERLGSQNILTKIIASLTGTFIGPIISFFKKNGFNIAIAIFRICFFI